MTSASSKQTPRWQMVGTDLFIPIESFNFTVSVVKRLGAFPLDLLEQF